MQVVSIWYLEFGTWLGGGEVDNGCGETNINKERSKKIFRCRWMNTIAAEVAYERAMKNKAITVVAVWLTWRFVESPNTTASMR